MNELEIKWLIDLLADMESGWLQNPRSEAKRDYEKHLRHLRKILTAKMNERAS